MNSNVFQEFVFKYFDFINNCLKESKYGIIKDSVNPFEKLLRLYKNKKSNELMELYEKMYNSIMEEDISKWILSIRDFGYFIRVIEKCYMYNNSESNAVYAENSSDSLTSTVYFQFTNYKIKILFEKSKIKNNSGNDLMDFINGNSANVTFITISIHRNFGKQMKNEFKFISGENPIFNDDSDRILFYNIKETISQQIYYTVKNAIDIQFGFMDIDACWKEVLKNGFWIRR